MRFLDSLAQLLFLDRAWFSLGNLALVSWQCSCIVRVIAHSGCRRELKRCVENKSAIILHHQLQIRLLRDIARDG